MLRARPDALAVSCVCAVALNIAAVAGFMGLGPRDRIPRTHLHPQPQPQSQLDSTLPRATIVRVLSASPNEAARARTPLAVAIAPAAAPAENVRKPSHPGLVPAAATTLSGLATPLPPPSPSPLQLQSQLQPHSTDLDPDPDPTPYFYTFGEVHSPALPDADWNLDTADFAVLGLNRLVFEVFISDQGKVVACTILEPATLTDDNRRMLEERLRQTSLQPAQRAGLPVASVRKIEMDLLP